jgi:hypothetical protein
VLGAPSTVANVAREEEPGERPPRLDGRLGARVAPPSYRKGGLARLSVSRPTPGWFPAGRPLGFAGVVFEGLLGTALVMIGLSEAAFSWPKELSRKALMSRRRDAAVCGA